MKILVVGDYSPIKRVAFLLDQKCYSTVFSKVKHVFNDADFSIVNFESCLANFQNDKPIEKSGPALCCDVQALNALRWLGVDCITLANNHFFDYGKKGVENTINVCRSSGLDFVGGGKNITQATATVYKKFDQNTLAIINCCENEFSIATEKHGGSNPLNPIRQYYSIKEARDNADFVLVIVHGGCEQFCFPTIRMQETYRFFIEVGADAVINHHQHCYSGYEYYHSKPIVYGLGNFLFDRLGKDSPIGWHEGYMTELNFDNKAITLNLVPYVQCLDSPTIELMKGEQYDDFCIKVKKMSEIIINQEALLDEIAKWYSQNSGTYKVLLSPWENKYMVAAYLRNLLPDFISKRKYLTLLNNVRCEAHRDRLISYLYEKTKL